LFYLGYELRRVLHLERLRTPAGLGWGDVVLGFVLPGYGLMALGHRLAGRAVLIGYGLALLVFVATVGYPAANAAMGLMIAAHATSLASLLAHWIGSMTFRDKIGLALCTLLLVGLSTYGILLYNPFFTPLRVREEVIIIRPGGDAGSVRRGDWVTYRIRPARAYPYFDGARRAVWIQEGLGVGPVQGTAGDVVRFTPLACEVNGQAFPRQAFMPTSGELQVPEKSWFIWPRLAMNNRNVSSDQITETLRELALVQESQFVGRPLTHWFGRRQLTP
jgi:hypothetical protein